MAKQKITVAEFLSQAIDISGKSQKEIAQEVGWQKPNVLSMMKQGITKVPLDKVPALARACGVDEAHFLQLAMSEYQPAIWKVIIDTVGEPLSSDEKKMLEEYRATRDTVERVEDEELVE